MRKKIAIPIIIVMSIIFNIGYAIASQDSNKTIEWPFSELGPAIMQDSYYVRAPGVESPFGIIGDVPGGYSIYSGSPLQSGPVDRYNDSLSVFNPTYRLASMDLGVIILGVLFAVVPVTLILILGRKSYGSTKT